MLPAKEGGYVRTGSRTPMQWDAAAASAEALYLPVDSAADAPTVAESMARPDSLWHWVQLMLKLRAEHPALGSYASFDVAAAPADGRAFAYVRSAVDAAESLLIAMNPGRDSEIIDVPEAYAVGAVPLVTFGWESAADVCATASGATLLLPPQSFVILKAA
ncbi:alpha amylase, catalytic region [Bifidobacterium saguini DSM 23967]|uniref:Alpha amylase, catalytic region n=2 Tax=Bifidobacterium saguini TaxID=762210 RepID=A0A087DBH6_9BIFI|nr:DUF3459 domain-containing protein [Bifidobacterium saguini]KFI92876.1 alpha amylase, catalytic region [Bifidobacterium saguini DSM 23967]QTB91865.1 DUF3459 domain-containing protein [Bifidobacterium saguini]